MLHCSVEEVTGNLVVEVPQWFIAVLIYLDTTVHKINGCQTGRLQPFEKIHDGLQNGHQKDKKIENCTKNSPIVVNCHDVARFYGFWSSEI